MTLDEKIRKTLAELGVRDAEGVHALFDQVRAAMEIEGKDRSRWSSQRPDALRVRWLGRRNSILACIDENWLKAAPKELRPAVGSEFNSLKGRANAMLDLNLERFGIDTLPPGVTPMQAFRHDLTLPGNRRPPGSIHPVTRVMREIEDIFLQLGFHIEAGPEIETVYYNFDALNIPETHPSRDDWDTLYVNEKTLLRTHTSPVQIRAMQKYNAPLYIIAPGKVYRHDNPDSSHATMFHQVEGLAVDRDITFADLKGTLDFFAKKFFGEKVRTSFHPSFFPFTEPSGEVAINCAICDGQGCRVCKESGWLEVMGCGMVHPEVLRHGGIDPGEFTGWAFGLGVERYAMMKYGVNDIQLFYQSDLRFLEQF